MQDPNLPLPAAPISSCQLYRLIFQDLPKSPTLTYLIMHIILPIEARWGQIILIISSAVIKCYYACYCWSPNLHRILIRACLAFAARILEWMSLAFFGPVHSLKGSVATPVTSVTQEKNMRCLVCKIFPILRRCLSPLKRNHGLGVWFGSLEGKKGRKKEGIAWGWSKYFILIFWKPVLRSIWNENVIVKWGTEDASVKIEAETFQILWMFVFFSHWSNVWYFDLKLWLALVNLELLFFLWFYCLGKNSHLL